MNYNKIILLFILLFYSVNFANAENGSILISDDRDYSWTEPADVGLHVDLSTQLLFYNLAYNYLGSFKFYCPTCTFIKSYERSPFTISAGGTGSGEFWYDASLKTLNYVFLSNSQITSDKITLLFTNSSVIANVTHANTYAFCAGEPTAEKPVRINGTDYNRCPVGVYYNVTAATRATDYYNVIYPIENYFSVYIDKNNDINTQYKFEYIGGEYSNETTPNKDDINGATFFQRNGIIINATLESGGYTKTVVNMTSLSEIFTINFNKTQYSLYDDVGVYYNIENYNPTSNYYLRVYQNFNSYNHHLYPFNSGNIVLYIDKTLKSYLQAEFIKDGVSVFTSDLIPYGFINESTNFLVTGNISLNKNSYNLSEIVEINYNISTNGRITIKNNQIHDDVFIFDSEISSGINQKINYTINDVGVDIYYVKLYYFLSSSGWVVLDQKTFTSKNNIVETHFNLNTVEMGEHFYQEYTSNQSGYLVLKDSQNNTKYNYSISDTSGFYLSKIYNVQYSDYSGIWIGYIYDLSGNVLSSDTITVNSQIQPSETVITPEPPTSLIDVSNEIGIAVFGNIEKDNKGHFTEEGMSSFGDKIFYTTALLCLIAILMMIFSKKR